MKNKTFYITSPLYYVNAQPHIGHSYTQIICDCISRYKRMKGEKVLFLTGTDEYGQKVLRSAEKEKKETLEFVDGVVGKFKDIWDRLDISYDDFIRTTENRHKDTVHKALTALYENGDIYQDEYKGFYCTPCETFWPKTQLTEKICPDCKGPIEEITETNYFFKLSKYQDWLIDYIKNNPDFIKPDFRANEVLGYLKEPLNDLCVSRPRARLSWGIDIPFSKEHVTYVWFDALINYISASGWGSDDDTFKNTWPADFHIIGKDILRPHAVYWPIMLHALRLEPPKTIFAHGWWLMGGEKMSKSKGNVIDPFYMVDRYGKNGYRHFMLREVTLGLDGTFSEEALIKRFNSDLANDIGNLLNRTLTMVEKYFDGVAPEIGDPDMSDKALLKATEELPNKLDKLMPDLKFNQALIAIWEVISISNKHIEIQKPWELIKNNQIEKLKSVMYVLLQVLSYSSILLYPFMPDAAMGIAEQLGMELKEEDMTFESLSKKILTPGTKIKKGSSLFPRIQ